jgi:hypothetical protein
LWQAAPGIDRAKHANGVSYPPLGFARRNIRTIWKPKRCTCAETVYGVRSRMAPSEPYTPAALRRKARANQKRYRETPQERWGFPSDYAAILSLLDCIPTRDELRPDTVPQPPPPKPERRRGRERLHGEAARLRNNRLTRIYYARMTPEQRDERNRKRREHYARQRAERTKKHGPD